MDQDEVIAEVNHIAKEVAFGVKNIEASHNPVVGILLITTLEDHFYKLNRNNKGFRVVYSSPVFNEGGDTFIFETIDAFLNKVSPLYRAAFVEQLHSKFL